MPTVPKYDRSQIAPAGPSGVRVSPGAPDGAFGGGSRGVDLTGVTRVASDIFTRERQKADQIAVLNASARLSETATTLQVDAATRRGEAAFTLPEDVSKKWKEAVESVEAGLTTEEQRLSVRNRALSEWDALSGNIQRHVAGERQEFDKVSTESFIEKKRESVLANTRDPALVKQGIAEMRAAFRDYANRVYNGKPPKDWLDVQLLDITSKANAGVIAQLLDSEQFAAAQFYFDENKSNLTAADSARIDKALQEGNLLGESMRRADEIMKVENVSRSQAFELTRTIEEPRLRQETEQRLEVEFRRRDQAENEAYDALQEQAATYIEDGRRPPTTIWSQLKSKDRVAMNRWLQERLNPGGVKTDVETFYNLKTQAYSDDPKEIDKFVNTDLLSFRHKLTPTDFKDLLNRQIRLRRGEKEDGDDERGYMTVNQLVNATLSEIGLSTKAKPGTAEAQRVASFRKRVDELVALEKENKNKKVLSPTDLQSVIDGALMRDVIVKKSPLWGMIPRGDSTASSGLLSTEERANATSGFSQKIPEGDRRSIESSITRAGGKLTPQRVERAYRAYRDNQRALFNKIITETE